MLLREALTQNTRLELLELARSYELPKCSSLKKDLLIDRIVAYLCSEQVVRSRLACLTKEQMDLYRKACISPTPVSVNDVIDAMNLYMFRLGYFEDPTDNFCIYEDIGDVFRSIDDEKFRIENKKKGWMMKCMHFFAGYQGIAPLEVVYKMFRQQVKCSLFEMIELIKEISIDISECGILSMAQLGMLDWPKQSPLYSENGLLVHIPLLVDNNLEDLIEQQYGKEFFIPSRRTINEISRNHYEVSEISYKNLEVFFVKKLGLTYEKAVTWCLQVWANSCEGNSPTEILNAITDAGIQFDSDKLLNEFVGLLMKAYNNTRLKENRGHKPEELSSMHFKGGMPTIVPGSSNAAAMLKEAGPQLEAMGFPIDIDGASDTIETSFYPNGLNGKSVKIDKKIYPNDPCPCGSGAKYKKCCGKK